MTDGSDKLCRGYIIHMDQVRRIKVFKQKGGWELGGGGAEL